VSRSARIKVAILGTRYGNLDVERRMLGRLRSDPGTAREDS